MGKVSSQPLFCAYLITQHNIKQLEQGRLNRHSLSQRAVRLCSWAMEYMSPSPVQLRKNLKAGFPQIR